MLDVRRRACLEAMGIELWREKVPTDAPANRDQRRAEIVGHDLPGELHPGQQAVASSGPLPEVAPAWEAADRPAITATVEAGPESAPPPLESAVSTLGWEALHATVASCEACDLHQTRTQTVFGVGDQQARLMVIGEAPGADEDRQGEPFVGRAGQLLNAMLEAIGFSREQVYIANIIKCRPPGNRDPHAEEAAACQPFLHRQIALIQPRLILSVGRISAHNLLGTEETVGRLRGRTHRFEPGDIPLIVTYHPAYLLRRPQEKAKAWQDLQTAYRVLGES